jgi:ubiquinone/menaquinone biosynthesis C-methylase UbiE
VEERKLKEIEHSKQRREILQGFERITDTDSGDQVTNLEELVSDKASFDMHFSNMKYYSITALSLEYQNRWIKSNCHQGAHILDFACGNGENGIFASEAGATCSGIDISPEGVENSNKNAVRAGVGDRCKFQVMDGENMSFEDNTFDLGVEYGALHHVELDAALSELARVIKPTGSMICVEALRHNPIIHWYRHRTPHLRTEWEVEHILGVESLDIMRKYFGSVEVKYFHLAALAAVPFRKTFLFRPLLRVLNFVDKLILNNQFVGKYGWIMIVTLGNPVK